MPWCKNLACYFSMPEVVTGLPEFCCHCCHLCLMVCFYFHSSNIVQDSGYWALAAMYSNTHAKINSVDGQTSDNCAWTWHCSCRLSFGRDFIQLSSVCVCTYHVCVCVCNCVCVCIVVECFHVVSPIQCVFVCVRFVCVCVYVCMCV